MAATETNKKDWFEVSVDAVAKANAAGLLPKPKAVACFEYHDEAGNVVYEKQRIEPGRNGRRKDFSFRRRQPGGGGWVYGFEGVKPVLYRLPEMIDPRFKDHPLFIVEGEAKVDALRALGFRATCAPFGAGRWLEDFGPRFVGRRCVILPDNDEPGIRHSQMVAAHLLHWEAAEIRVVFLAGLPDKGDVIDFLRFTAGGPASQKAAIINAVKATKYWRLFDGEPEIDHRQEFAVGTNREADG